MSRRRSVKTMILNVLHVLLRFLEYYYVFLSFVHVGLIAFVGRRRKVGKRNYLDADVEKLYP